MKRRILSLALLIGGAGYVEPLYAGESSRPPERTNDLTLGRAVEIALRQNPEILKALQEIERTRGQIIEIRAAALPHLTATGNYNQVDPNLLESGGSSTFGSSTGAATLNSLDSTLASLNPQPTAGGTLLPGITPQELTNLVQPNGQGSPGNQGSLGSQAAEGSQAGGNDKSWNVTFQINQVLYAGGQVRAALSIAQFSKDTSYWSLRDTVDRIISQVRTQFATILLNRALITVQEESVQLLTNQLKDQQNRLEAGTVPRFNVLQAEVELSNARPDLIRARNNYLIAQLQLAKSLGLAPGPNGKPAFNALGTLTLPGRPIGLNSALQLAKERRPFLKVQRQSILIEVEQIKVALAGYKPRLDANAGYLFRNSRRSDDLGDVVNGWFFGATGSWAIFDGLETYGKTKQARARLESAKVNYEDAVRQVELEVQQAYAGLQQARETIQSQQKGVESAIEALRLSNERLSAGAGTQLDVLNARVALTRARTTELQARADYNTALAEYDRATATDTIYNDSFQDPLATKAKQLKKPVFNDSAKKTIPLRER